MPEKKLEIKNILEIKQPIGLFLIGVVKAKELLKISSPDPRRYNEELDEYIGIQREIDANKIEQLQKFIKTNDSTFPNCIIGTLSPDEYEYDNEKKVLHINENPQAFSIIDGQHRLASFYHEEAISEKYDLIVAFFMGLDLEMQAYLFSIINMTQKKLNPSLMQDLTELFTITTPEKFAHILAKAFNEKESSPWHKQIKMLGKKEERYSGIISQYTFTKGIVNLITDTKMYYDIRDILKRTKNNRKKLSLIRMDKDKYIFWNDYINGNDKNIYQILKTYFLSIKETFPEQWCNKEYILNKSTGYAALMRFLKYLYCKADESSETLNMEFFVDIFKKVKGSLRVFESRTYPPGKARGEDKLYADLVEAVKK